MVNAESMVWGLCALPLPITEHAAVDSHYLYPATDGRLNCSFCSRPSPAHHTNTASPLCFWYFKPASNAIQVDLLWLCHIQTPHTPIHRLTTHCLTKATWHGILLGFWSKTWLYKTRRANQSSYTDTPCTLMLLILPPHSLINFCLRCFHYITHHLVPHHPLAPTTKSLSTPRPLPGMWFCHWALAGSSAVHDTGMVRSGDVIWIQVPVPFSTSRKSWFPSHNFRLLQIFVLLLLFPKSQLNVSLLGHLPLLLPFRCFSTLDLYFLTSICYSVREGNMDLITGRIHWSTCPWFTSLSTHPF